MASPVKWEEDRFVVGGTVFQTIPEGLLEMETPHIEMEGADFLLLKDPPVIDHEAELIGDLRPQRIFELGIYAGGGTAFLLEVARPQLLAAIDLSPGDWPELREHVKKLGFEDSLRLFGGVDQADRVKLAEIVRECFGEEPLDLVVDDASHLYDHTRESFNELFPRLRPGGVYVIEDWSWAHARLDAESGAGLWPDQMPLTRLVFELVMALPSRPELFDDVAVDENTVIVRRGEEEVDPSGFDVSACIQERGRNLMAEPGVQRGLRDRLRALRP